MPVRPENKHRYPSDWKEISLRIRTVRAAGRCECVGECGVDHGGRCAAENGKAHPVTGSKVVLTTAHRDHTPENVDDANLFAACQRCHLRYDRDHHRATAAATRRAAAEAGGQTVLDADDPMTEGAHRAEAMPAAIEYLYGIKSGHFDGNDDWQETQVVSFRITKKTARRIYYVAEEFAAYAPRIRYIDRQEIERTGQLIRRTAGWWEPDFALHLTPPVLERPKAPNLAALKAEMAAAHPDAGGTDEAFIAARKRYEAAAR